MPYINTARVQTLFLLLIFALAVSVLGLTKLYPFLFSAVPIDPALLVPQHRVGLSPKPEERFIFLLLGFLFPLIAYWSAGKFIKEEPGLKTKYMTAWIKLLPAVISLLFFFPFIGFDFSQALLSGKSMPPEHPLRYLAFCGIASAVWYGYLAVSRCHLVRTSRLVSVLAWTLFLSAMFLQLAAWRVVGDGSITIDAAWWNSADAVVYSISQVAAGKTVLADLPAQYGLYGEFIGPLFRVMKFSVMKLTALFGVLQVASLVAVFYVMHRFVREPMLKITFGVALVMVTFETSLWMLGIRELYFQYWPIRFIWPAVSVVAFYRYSQKRSLFRASIISFAGAIGSIWNADSGLVIELAFAAFLLGKGGCLYLYHQQTSQTMRRHFAKAFALHIAIFIVVTFGMFAYMTGKANKPLHYSWLYEYQRLFYGLGFMMLPLPLKPHPWMPILAIYLVGIIVGVSSWKLRPKARKADVIFFLSFLGLGLFLYYEGRAHVLNLISVCWPALLIAAILADHVVRLVRTRQLSTFNLCIPVVVLTLIAFCCIPFGLNLGRLWNDAFSNYITRGTPVDPLVSDELAFIRANSIAGKDCLILSKRQGFYHALTKTGSPVLGPGYAELLTMQDRDSLVQQLSNKVFECVFIGVGPNSDFELGIDPLKIFHGYRVLATSSKGSMLYLGLKSSLLGQTDLRSNK